jgi:hypothetical protein
LLQARWRTFTTPLRAATTVGAPSPWPFTPASGLLEAGENNEDE